MPFDEINALKAKLKESKPSKPDLLDEILDILLLAYANGNADANAILGGEYKPQDYEIRWALDRVTQGKNYVERINNLYTDFDIEKIARVIETEAHRIYNEASFGAARENGAKYKIWQTMKDDKVRDTHSYLDGVETLIYGDFYTYDDDMASYPGGFVKAENNVNCRCYLTYR